MLTTTFTITDLQRGLLFKNGSFEKVLTPGKHRFWLLTDDYHVTTYDITDIHGVVIDNTLEQLLALYPERFEEHLNIVETDLDHIALVYRDGQVQPLIQEGEIAAVLYRSEQLLHLIEEGQTIAYWQGVNTPRIEYIRVSEDDIDDEDFEVSEDNELPETIGKQLIKLGWSHRIIQRHVKHNEKLLMTRQKQFVRIESKGNYYFWAREDGLTGETFTTTQVEMSERHDLVEIAQEHPETATHLTLCETEINEIALVYQKGVLVDYVAPARKGVYWNGTQPLKIIKQTVESGQVIDSKLLTQLENNSDSAVYAKLLCDVTIENISEQQTGFLYLNGKLIEQVEAGQHLWWNFDSDLELKQLDLRLQNMEVNGQEILTKDRVNLRINLLADWKIIDAATVINELSDHQMHLYRELQLALRTVVSTKTLDELLDDKNLLNQDVMVIVAEKVKAFGLELQTVGVKDIILPGEMREILGQVVEAQKMAEANLIKRREETQATRSLHNTAKVMEGNPTLLRLKELEVLEKITTQVGTLNVYGGLEGVMNNMVHLPKDVPVTMENKA